MVGSPNFEEILTLLNSNTHEELPRGFGGEEFCVIIKHWPSL